MKTEVASASVAAQVSAAVSAAVRAFSDPSGLVITIARGVPTKSGERRDLLRIRNNATQETVSYFLNATTDEIANANGVTEQHFAIRQMRAPAPAPVAPDATEVPF